VLPLATCLALFGCGPPNPICVDLRPDTNRPNHLQPFQVAIDADRHTLYSTSLASPNVAVVDLDTLTVLRVLRIGDLALDLPDLAVADDHHVWVVSQSNPGLLRLDPDGGPIKDLDSSFAAGRALTAVPGGVIVSGRRDDSDQRSTLVRFDLDAHEQAAISLDERAPDLLSLPDDGAVAVVTSAPALELRDATTLALVERCTLPQPATHVSRLDDGLFVLSSETAAITLHCPGDDAVAWPLGTEITEVVGIGDVALALDRIGPGGDWDPNAGVVWRIDADGPDDSPAFATGKNSGFGAVDPATGWLWLNSEGTTEVQAYDLDSGALQARVSLGRFLDGLTLTDTPDELVVTGRLSDTLVRIADGTIAAEVSDDDATRWPYAPAADPDRGLVWVRSQTDGTVAAYDLQTLSRVATVALDVPPDPGLVFGTMLLDPGRDRLYVTEPWADALFEVDPDTAAVTHRWQLGGPALTDRDAIGELALHLDPDGQALLIIRTSDGRAQRLDPDTDALQTVVPEYDLDADPAAVRAESTCADPERGVVYVSGRALDARTLQHRKGLDREVARVIAPWPDGDGGLLAQDIEQLDLVHVDADGDQVGGVDFARKVLHPTVFRLAADGARVWLTRNQGGLVCPYELDGTW